MGIFSRLKEWIMSKFSPQTIEKNLGVKLLDMGDMPELVQTWGRMYQGNPPWLSDKVTTLNLPTIICSDLAKKAIAELKVGASVNNGAKEDELAKEFLKEAVLPFLRSQVEYSLAIGGIIMRPWYDQKAGKVRIGWYTAEQIIPLEWDNKKLSGAILIDQRNIVSNGVTTYYTKLEAHKFQEGGVYTITTRFFKSSSSADLGTQIPSAGTVIKQWDGIDTDVIINNLTAPLFVYMGTPWANNKLINNPTGCSIFKDAVQIIEELDKTWSTLNWEREGGEMRLFIDQSMLPSKLGDNGEIVYEVGDKADRRLYRKLDVAESSKALLDPWAPELRINDLLTKLKSDLSLACMACHLDPGAYVYDSDKGAVTATEVRSKNQQTYGTIVDIQVQMIQPAVSQIVDAVRSVQQLYGIEAFADDVSLGFDWGDSILVDSETERVNAQAEVASGLRSKLSYLMTYRGMTEEQARAELAQIKADSPAPVSMFA